MYSNNNRTIAQSLKPTFENVTREFITETLYKILFSEEIPNFRFDFKENEAIEFIEKILKEYTEKYDYYKEESLKIIETIKKKTTDNDVKPVMTVNNYKEFFELLRQFYEKTIELFFLRTQMSGFQVREKDNCFEQIWLRATPEDFNNPENFLRKQVKMINDKTFKKYDEETYIGKIPFFDDNILCVKNGIARTWDENSRQFEIRIYDKKYFSNTELFVRPHYILPVVRYGIYEKNGKKVCYIGSIQNKDDDYEENKLREQINKRRTKVNKGVKEEDTILVEPKNLLSLSIFINFLNKERITEIEVPEMYVLDYEFHQKENEQLLNNFNKDWTEKEKNEWPKIYEKSLHRFKKMYKKEDLISEIKTERLMLTLRRLLCHYNKAKITSYPEEGDCLLHMNIPTIRSEDEINGEVLKELYKIVDNKYVDIER